MGRPANGARRASRYGRMAFVDRAVAEVNLAAIGHNVMRLKAAAPGAALMAVVKADGYGHGMIPAARAARTAGADYLGVALPTEAVEVRESGDGGPLMCWLYTPSQDLAECVERRVDLSASSLEMLDQVVAAARKSGQRARLHLKVDTGLGRGGAALPDWPALVAAAGSRQDTGVVEIVGIWSHLASADEPHSGVTEQQLAVFTDALAQAAAAGIEPPLRHLAASGGVFGFPATHFDLVRCGISVYGLTPGPVFGSSTSLGLIPAMRVTARVALVKHVSAGQGVSYGLRYRTRRATQLALIPVGYADGLPRSGSGRLPVAINGVRHTVAGTVAMDQVTVDVGDARVKPGDEVVLFGPGGRGEPTADEWAAACATINYEIVTRLGPRIPRRHLGGA